MTPRRLLPVLTLLLTASAANAQAPAASAPADAPLDPQARALLDTLHDRRNTLKDFTATIDYSVRHPVTDETSGKRGTVDFLMDPARGPVFTVDFAVDTDESGKPKRTHHQQIIFDGTDITTRDFGSREYMTIRELPPGASPGDAVSLNGPLTLPIGIDVNDVLKNFQVSLAPAPAGGAPDQATLRLVPRAISKFDFKQLDITIDKKLELPIKLVQTAKGRQGDITTIKLTDIQPNTGKAKMQDLTPPPGWTQRNP
jgi:hypothetical protein